MNKFEVGDCVKLSEMGREQYQDGATNPHELTGKVIKVDGRYVTPSKVVVVVTVKWSSGVINNYCEADLDFTEEVQKPLKDFCRIKKGPFVYYFATKEQRERVLEDLTDRSLMLLASIVIDTERDQIVKNRYSMSDILEWLLG